MILDEFTSVLSVKSREGFRSEVDRFTGWLGFEKFNATVVLDVTHTESRFAWVDNTPAAFEPLACNFERARVDPVAQHCKTFSTPIVWDQGTYTSLGLGPHWEEQAAHGYKTGIALALHLPRRFHIYIGLDRAEPLPSDRLELSRMVSALHLFAAFAQDAGLRLLLPSLRVDEDFEDLTRRELECLKWTMEGKTAWEVGQILSISEQTAVRHLVNATRKLECINKHQAVVKAMRLGLIQ
ncbi:helix-turn-helix transcriptional regulator [Piscinibacter terrae]|uniref:LuxR family transcriptional regulator n=1 Tax=Piscinibacter terrae TaxID=2496871 RepID=A0A3N7HPZ7_9BURK|nr:LuxR C-terminal-related transcriptional regulator [Albitalea terrae]RQP24298.1 LuxR family transcriptional regulator [Albitalea terrae]